MAPLANIRYNAATAAGAPVPFILFLKSFENLLFEIMSWLVFYPRTLWRSGRHPLRMMKRSEQELSLPAPEQFKDVVGPPIFLLLTVIVAYAVEVAVVGASPIIDNGIGLAALIQDNTTLILFRLFIVATLPLIAASFGVAALHRPLDRGTLQPLFYAQCFATTPVVLMLSIGASVSRLPQTAADQAAYAILAAAALFYLVVEAQWFTRETGRGPVVGLLWAVAAFVTSVAVLTAAVLLFSGA
jgi:hypothetical protein